MNIFAAIAAWFRGKTTAPTPARPAPPEPKMVIETPPVKVDAPDNLTDVIVARAAGLMPNPVDILARTLWGEARGEGAEGMQAVADVICTRAAHPLWWGRTIITVCLEPMQFSSWNADDPNREKMLAVTAADPVFAEALALAARAVAGTLPDITGGADSYFASSIAAPRWALPSEFIKRIGNQNFYRVVLRSA